MTTPTVHDSFTTEDLAQAFLRASRQAQRIAQQTGTPLAVWRDGTVCLIPPETVLEPPHSPPEANA